mgnify:FL=1
MNDKIYTIDEIKEILSPIAASHGIKKVFLFGSYARGEATAESDIDFRIDAPSIDSLFQMGALYADLEDAFGKKFDLITNSSLKYTRDTLFLRNMRRDEKVIYDSN